MLNIRLINTSTEFEKLRDDWADTLGKSAVDTIYLTNEWLYTWWQIYGDNSELFILTARDDDESLVGIAPLMIKKYSFLPSRRFPVRQIQFLGVGNVCSSDHMDFIIKKGVEEGFFNAVFDFIIKSRDRWDTIKLTYINEDSDSIPYLQRHSEEHGLIYKHENLTKSPFIKLPKRVQEYNEGKWKKLQKEMGKYTRRLHRDFDARCDVVDSADKLEDSIDELTRINRKRWNQKGTKSSFSSQKMTLFHKKISKIFFEKGWLDFCFMNLDGRNVACFYNFIYKERDYGYLAAFDPSPVYSRYSIGMLMINHGVERAIKQECREFDLGRGVDKYKMRYATDVNESVSVRIGRKNPKGILMTSILDVGSSLKNFMIWILPEEIINKIKGRVIDTDLSVFK